MRVNSPITINKKVIKNRLTMAPTVKFDYAEDDGKVTERHVEHYRERAEHGCGLICVEATAVSPEGRFCKTHLGLWEDAQTEGHKAIVEACHKYGAAVLIQLNHTGITTTPDVGPSIGPSAVPVKTPAKMSKEMSIDEIHAMQELFVNAAIRAKNAGYDGIQLHGCHGYLINQFISRKTNLRTDEYGILTNENRARFASEIIAKVRECCGPDFIISVRTAGIEPNVSSAISVAEEYVKAGCDYLQVSTGIEWEDSSLKERGEPYNLICSLGVRFHDHFAGRVPVSCANGLLDPKTVRYLIEHELVDTVDLARAVLADPAFCEAVLNNAKFTKCSNCLRCQYGPGMAHRCPALSKRMGLNVF